MSWTWLVQNVAGIAIGAVASTFFWFIPQLRRLIKSTSERNRAERDFFVRAAAFVEVYGLNHSKDQGKNLKNFLRVMNLLLKNASSDTLPDISFEKDRDDF